MIIIYNYNSIEYIYIFINFNTLDLFDKYKVPIKTCK